MSAEADGGWVEREDALIQLCGELFLQHVPVRPPGVVRSDAAAGLELLDLLYNPDHIVRVTEELTLQNTLMLGRRVRLDVALDGLSPRQEEGATQLSGLVSGRVELGAVDPLGPQLLWLPLDTVSRPVPVGVTVVDSAGRSLPRPPQRAIRRVLAAALAQLLEQALQTHAELELTDRTRGVASGRVLDPAVGEGRVALWLLESSVLSVCELGAATPRSDERRQTPVTCAAAVSSYLEQMLDELIKGEKPSVRRTALLIVRDVLLHDRPFLELLRLVYGQYFVIAGVDCGTRHHLVHYDLPECEANGDSAIRSLALRALSAIDPRQHNFSFHVRVPLPDNVNEYNVWVSAVPEGSTAARYDVSLVGAIGFDRHPARSALDALATCAAKLDANPASAAQSGYDPTNDHDDDEPASANTTSLKRNHLLSRAFPAVESLEATVAKQARAAAAMEARAGRASRRKVRQLLGTVRNVIDEALNQLSEVRKRLAGLQSGTSSRVDSNETTTATLVKSARQAMEHELLQRQLVSSPLTGQEIGRLNLRRSTLAPSSGPRARWLDLWVTVSDESRPYAFAAIGPPLGLALLLYLVGALLLNSATWPVHVPTLSRATIENRQADAIAGVLLLIPGFALTQFHQPDPLSVFARLHRPGHFFVLGTIVAIGTTSVVVATQIGVDGDTPTHPALVLWSLRAALGAFTLLSFWAALASVLRRSNSWRPRGLTWLQDRAARGLLRRALFRLVRYRAKPSDAVFDLAMPGRATSARPGAGERWLR